jgi:hypothetical protein
MTFTEMEEAVAQARYVVYLNERSKAGKLR